MDKIGETSTFVPEEGAPSEGCFYLLVIETDRGSSEVVDLPVNGTLLIGREKGVGLRFEHTKVSRQHAKIVTVQHQARIEDLGSHNGTFVNGERLQGPRDLVSGDVIVIGIGQCRLVLQNDPPPRPREALDIGAFREFLRVEVERSAAFGRSLGVVVAGFAAVPAGDEAPQRAALKTFRTVDQFARDQSTQLVALVLEAQPNKVRAAAERLVAALSDEGVKAHAGFSVLWRDGCDADTLWAAARAAAAEAMNAPLGTVRAAEEGVVTHTFGDCPPMVLADMKMVKLFERIRKLAPSDLPVLILGESGVGKEQAARAVHALSSRASGPFIAVNSTAIPEALVDSELFGHKRGAFTGALADRAGVFERAHGGTLFLDEIGDLPAGTQVKLLRALQEKRVVRVGDDVERPADARVVAATNRDLDAAMKAGLFREDLFFRLEGARLALPPLRERRREIALLARRFLAAACEDAGRAPMTIAPSAMQRLASSSWPGNVRQLGNVMIRLAAMVEETEIGERHVLEHLSPSCGSNARDAGVSPAFDDALAVQKAKLERSQILRALEEASWKMRDAAQLLGMPVRTLLNKRKKYGIKRPPKPRR